ncbi:GNAT family N-acetyltransferase [Neobacillus mesonae]|nr:GNAT family N-acetyltransferase [Neobacillus mesonae]
MYHKEMFIISEGKPIPVVIRNYAEADFNELIAIQAECFPPPFPAELLWNKEQLSNHITLFPQGALCVEVDGTLAGSMTGLGAFFDPNHPEHSWSEATDEGYIRNHRPDGDTLYVVDISVRPAFRKLGIGQLLMQAMYHVVIQEGMKRLLGGGRMPGYHKAADSMSAAAYLSAVVAGELRDPVISFLLRCGRTPVTVVADYLDDEESCNYGALMEWRNPFK